jgi:hypothetical protein
MNSAISRQLRFWTRERGKEEERRGRRRRRKWILRRYWIAYGEGSGPSF